MQVISTSPADASIFDEEKRDMRKSKSHNKYYNLLRREIDKLNL